MCKLYLAPLEGITGYCYRACVNKYFGGEIDKFFTPFFAPHTKRTMNTKEMNDVLLEHNKGMYLVPQILTNSADDFLRFEKDMQEKFGYEETNINMGCPSGTVVSKGRGAGILSDLRGMDEFLYDVFEKKHGRVSLKVRLGIDTADEFYDIFEILSKYEAEEIIIHPRVRNEFYKGECHFDIFKYAYDNSRRPLCWSGDINSVEDYKRLIQKLGRNNGKEACSAPGKDEKFPFAVMLGRGMVADPSLIRQIKGGDKMTMEELEGFHDELLGNLADILPGNTPLMHKMKEIWLYMINTFDDRCFEKMGITRDRALKNIQKCKSMNEYKILVKALITEYVPCGI